jgi:asparagine synthase (glutamine-hydrolysing)
MCGVVGWVSFDRELAAEHDIAQRMTETMTCRGPDESGIWTCRHAMLGHRRLAVIDIDGGKQPMALAAVGLSYSGEVYNFVELRDELRRRGHRFTTRSDTEVVLRGYLEWTDSLPERLNGMFAFAIWDDRKKQLLLVRDRLGVKPLYYYETPDGVLFGSEPKAVFAHPQASKVLDIDGLREALSWTRTPGHAVWKGLREVRPGCVVTVDRSGIRERPYWRLSAQEHTDGIPATVHWVRELLEDIVDRQLVADVPRCTLLSGGLDSSVITSLAQRRLGAAEQIRSFSVDFVNHHDNFAPDPFRDAPDTPFALEVSAFAGTAHENIVLDAKQLADPEVRRAVITARDLPTGFGDADNSLYLLFRTIRQRSTVALSGESADEVFGGYQWFHQPEAVHAGTFPWVSHSHVTSPNTGLSVFESALLSTLDIPGYVQARYHEAVAETPVLDGESDHERRMRELCYLHLTRYLRILLDRKDRLSMAVGLEVRVPFCDHRLVEYVFNAPWAMKNFDGREKSLLRAAARDVVPPSVAQRRKAPYPSTRDPVYVGELLDQAKEISAAPNHPVHDLTNRTWLRDLLRCDATAVPPEARVGLERWLDLTCWLEVHRPDLQLR